MPHADLKIDPTLISSLPSEMALSYKVLPLRREDDRVIVATCRELAADEIADLTFVLGDTVLSEHWSETNLEVVLEQHYGPAAEEPPVVIEEYTVAQASVSFNQEIISNSEIEDVSVADELNRLISQAVSQKASDIHIESFESEVRIRFRVDGVLHTRKVLPYRLKDTLISRVKIMADLDIAERRRPQDGRIQVTNGTQAIDIRVSTLPTSFGEKIVLRILDKGILKLDLNLLGLAEAELNIYKDAISAPNGMILVTGPTGSGKTTTLYATLNFLNREGSNIVTIEDPIEYNMPGINQSHMRADIGFTFASALKTFLRQDPDIIMVGEIRDFETAEIAIRAALTGHLVLSTLHTNDAPSAVTRLVDMGVPPFLVASCVRLVIAQRLVRRICTGCKEKSGGSTQHNPPGFDLPGESYCGRGCKDCHQTGYSGRTALIELFNITPSLADLISQGSSSLTLKHHALKNGMKTLEMSGTEKVKQGISSVDEVLRETRG